MSYRVLLVDENATVQEMNTLYLKQEGFEVLCAGSGQEALSLMREEPDCVVLDVLLPDANGFFLAPKLRSIYDCPVIFLTACDEDSDFIDGFSQGDDFMTKPYNLKELSLRILSHIHKNTLHGRVIDCSPLILHVKTSVATMDGVDMELTPREYAILRFLAERKNQVVDSFELYRGVWQNETVYNKGIIMVNISNLRKKLEAAMPTLQFIQTVRRQGYSFHYPPKKV